MKKVLLSAFVCDPTRGSEPACGWNWAEGLAKKGFEVHCLTRETSRPGIESMALPANLKVTYIRLPFGMEKLYTASQATQYLYYAMWQWQAYRTAAAMYKNHKFDIAHHVTWGNLKLGTFMYKLPIPLVFGPAGGGQTAPVAFKEYFGAGWSDEEKRNRASWLFMKFNPICRSMLKKAAVVLVSNEDTLRVAESNGATNARLALDVGVPEWFFPDERVAKRPQNGELRLLWVGRLIPLKGIMLVPEIMKELNDRPGITLTVVGDGAMRDTFLDKVKQYGLERSISFKGWVPFDEMREYYANHDVFLFTSLRDSGGVQLAEAMAFGMPIVTLDLHGRGLIVDSDRGFKCDASTPDIAIREMKSAILDLYNNPALVERLSEGSFKFADSQSWNQRICDVVKRFY